MKKQSLLSLALAAGVLTAVAVPMAVARQGADDAPGHVRHDNHTTTSTPTTPTPPTAAPARTRTFNGRVRAVSSDQFTLRVNKKRQLVIGITASTRVVAKNGTAATLATGQRVQVRVTRVEGAWVAKVVRVRTSSSSPASGDDHGRGGTHPEPGDDHGRGGSHPEPGDDHGRGRGGDDSRR